jgi:hypothetical protein
VLAVHPHGTLALNRAIFCFNKQDRYARTPNACRPLSFALPLTNKQQTTNNKQQTTNNKQQTTNNKQQTTNNKQQTT